VLGWARSFNDGSTAMISGSRNRWSGHRGAEIARRVVIVVGGAASTALLGQRAYWPDHGRTAATPGRARTFVVK